MSLADWIKQGEAHENETFARINAHMAAAIEEYESWFYAQTGNMGEPLDVAQVESLRNECLQICASAFARLYPGQRKQ